MGCRVAARFVVHRLTDSGPLPVRPQRAAGDVPGGEDPSQGSGARLGRHTSDPERRRRYQQARGKGGLVRASWREAVEMIAAAYVNTIKTHGA